jgi:hypothetical protein
VPRRVGGYAPISSYAAIGDGRTVALVSGDGSIDWLALPELSRRIEGVAGSVPMAWSVEPRFGYAVGARACRSRPPAATRWPSAPSTQAPEVAGGAIRGRFEARAGERALLALCAAHSEPLVLPAAS